MFRKINAFLVTYRFSLIQVNALRSNYNFTMLPSAKSDFGSCDMRIDDRKAQPPLAARGDMART